MEGFCVNYHDVGDTERTARTPVLKADRYRAVSERSVRGAFLWERWPAVHRRAPELLVGS